MPTSIVWFKTDLRLHDNETLVKALKQSTAIVPVYCFDESQFTTTPFGFKKTGSFRFKFLLESLTALDTALRKFGSGLLLLKGKPEEELAKIARLYNAKKVFAKREVAYEEKQLEDKVTAELWKQGCELETYSTSTLYHAEELPFGLRSIPDVFTAFRKSVERDAAVRPAFKVPNVIDSPTIPPITLPTPEEMGLETVEPDPRAAIRFKGGEAEGLERLNDYLFTTHAIATYKDTRNGMVGSNYSSKFSAWLAMGCLSPKQIYHEIKRYEAQHGENKSTYWLIFELMWRDYFRFMLKKHGNSLFLKGGFKNKPTEAGHDPEIIAKWINGNIGQDFIDANMLELKLTGFMSNRGRQNVASYLWHDLGIDWRYGAAYFEEQLIDYDPASNWGNWAYIAGVGNDPREVRRFNPQKQADDYDAKKVYRNLWLDKG